MSDLIKVFPGATQEQPASSPGRIYETLNYTPMRYPGSNGTERPGSMGEMRKF